MKFIKNLLRKRYLIYHSSWLWFSYSRLSNLLVKKVKDIELDFSPIAKGLHYKVYKSLEEQQNIKSFFIEIGGEIRSTSLKSNDQPWKAGIVNPLTT